MMTVCEGCGNEFTPTRRGTGLFCSHPCYLAYSTRNRCVAQCRGCGATFPTKPALLAVGKGKFCSRKCEAANRAVRPIAERFWEKVEKADGCWLWTASRDKRGYGRIMSGPRPAVPLLATRVSYELHFGPIPEGLGVLHRCDNPPCVRPDHLFLGTMAENVADMIAKGRQLTGEACPWAKLTADRVIELRRRFAEGGVSAGRLAEEFGINRRHASDIINGRRWTHVT